MAQDEINTTFFGNLAVEGYDAVAYFTEQRAVEGSAEFETNYKDANWRFCAAHLAAFQEDPERYALNTAATMLGQFRRTTRPASTQHNSLSTMKNYI